MPLLFIHGAWHAAWCWDEHFLDFFADKGYRALAVSLRGHGNSLTSKPLRTCSIADYVDDVGSVADSLPSRPVVIGHSMGGFVVQKYLASCAAPAGVSVASFPPRGIGGFLLRKMRVHPWLVTRALITGKSLRSVNTPELARESFFSAQTPSSQVVCYAARLQEESARVALDMTRNLPRPKRVTTPLLVLGAECDGIITTKEGNGTCVSHRSRNFPRNGS